MGEERVTWILPSAGRGLLAGHSDPGVQALQGPLTKGQNPQFQLQIHIWV